eukprot:6530296-Lingulodinium_polyedra.AAC.1
MRQRANWRGEEAAARGQEVSHVNLDETHAQLVPGRQRGKAVCVSTRRARRRAPTRNAPLSEQRAGFARVAL